MNGGSWKILEELYRKLLLDLFTLAVGLDVLDLPHGGHQMFLPVDRKDLRALL